MDDATVRSMIDVVGIIAKPTVDERDALRARVTELEDRLKSVATFSKATMRRAIAAEARVTELENGFDATVRAERDSARLVMELRAALAMT